MCSYICRNNITTQALRTHADKRYISVIIIIIIIIIIINFEQPM